MSQANTTDFQRWAAYYSDRFACISNDALKGYWYLYGRDSEESASSRDMAAWSTVNAEMQARGL